MSATRPRLTADARRQAVLDTACRVFSRSSYRGATTAEIAAEAGISEPILYRHFGSKRELYLACLDSAFRRLKACGEGDCGGLRIRAISEAYMDSTGPIRLIDLWIQALTVAAEDEQ